LLKAELEKLVDITRAEESCIDYDLHQNNENPAHFLFYWMSRERWRTPRGNRHLRDYMAATDGAVEEFTLNEMIQIAWLLTPPSEGLEIPFS
jgi:quinol monooxygenase YgiN